MRIKLRLEVSFQSEREAKIAKEALDPENYVYLTSEIRGNKLIFFGDYEKIGSLIHTLEDLNSCLGMLFRLFSEKIRKGF